MLLEDRVKYKRKEFLVWIVLSGMADILQRKKKLLHSYRHLKISITSCILNNSQVELTYGHTDTRRTK